MKKIGSLAAAFLFAVCSVQAQLNGITADLKLDQDQYLPGEDLQLKLRILNRSGQEIILGTDNNWVQLSVVDEKNRVCAKVGEMPVEGVFSLQSGEVGTKKLNPTPYYDFHRLGRYRITAEIQIPQWHQTIKCHSTLFTVFSGATIPNLANLSFGLPMPDGATNTPPEIRKYSLLRVTLLNDMKLYFRLTDDKGNILKTYPISRMMSFSEPDGQIDRFNFFHVLNQDGARSYTYCVINPDGELALRQSYVFSDSRPVLHSAGDGHIEVVGGVRQPSTNDYVSAAFRGVEP